MSARELGFSGKQVVHPSQIDVANEVFSPSAEELLEATRIVKIYENASKEKYGSAASQRPLNRCRPLQASKGFFWNSRKDKEVKSRQSEHTGKT